MKKTTTIQDYGYYSITGPTKLNLKIQSGDITEFNHFGFKFRQNHYSVLIKGTIKNKENILVEQLLDQDSD